MRQAVVGVVIALLATHRVAIAQAIPQSIAQAESEATAFQHASASPQAAFPASEAGGSTERRCMSATDRGARLSLRSGDIIVRGPLTANAGEGQKFLWIPLHAGRDARSPLALRAIRVGHPADSLRLSVHGPVHGASPSGPLYGYASLVMFPSAGQWMVVATAGEDWGCFLVTAE